MDSLIQIRRAACLWWAMGGFLSFCLNLQAACNTNVAPTQPDNRYELVSGSHGAEVRDKLTGNIWQRCVMGMSWNGSTCVGTPIAKTWAEAMQVALDAPRSHVSGASVWQLPNHADLYGLAERACYNPSINTTWFPETPPERTWSASLDERFADEAWHVSFSYGHGGHASKKQLGRIRLMRHE